MSDDELIERIRIGEEDAAELLIKRYYAAILRYCKWHCPDREKAEDLTQETFLKLFKGLSEYDGRRKFKSYLYTIASHLCIDESRRPPCRLLEDEDIPAEECSGFRQIEDREEIARLLKMLSEEQREAVILRFGEQMSYLEIAEIMGSNLRTAQSRVRNALKTMREG